MFLLCSFWTYSATDPGWSRISNAPVIENLAGTSGAWIADFLFSLIGISAYLFPCLMLMYAVKTLLIKREPATRSLRILLVWMRFIGVTGLVLSSSALSYLKLQELGSLPQTAGGIVGNLVGITTGRLLGKMGSILVLSGLFLVSLTMATGLSWFKVGKLCIQSIRVTRSFLYTFTGYLIFRINAVFDWLQKTYAAKKIKQMPRITPVLSKKHKKRRLEVKPPEKSQKILLTERVSVKKKKLASTDSMPSIDLLNLPEEPPPSSKTDKDELNALSQQLELRLEDFGVSAKVAAVLPGPVVTRFELELAPGIKVAKISSLAKDLARSLSVSSVRVVEVIPGKSVVGIEIPNTHRETVMLREVIESVSYSSMKSSLCLALGKDIAGEPIVADLAKMPHLLVAGTTGSGKSVGVNAMLLSMLYKATPLDLRLLLIDPKMLELSVYEGIPHLLAPVVTDMKDAANALKWCVAEMERRYQLLAAVGVRNLKGYNLKVANAAANDKPIIDPLVQPVDPKEQPSYLSKLPHIVVIIDEFADMIMVVGKKVEELIARIAQKARAAGIHMILATQRPSVDVITGLIKANVPTRISYQVSSKIDSRTILDQMGAEALLGHGDMLYLAPGTGIPVRVHGAFVSDDEVHSVVKDIKQRGGSPNYIDDITVGVSPLAALGNSQSELDEEPLYDEAVAIVLESRRASASNLQRRLKIGYNRASRIIEMMETVGLVTPMQSNGVREVIVPVAD